MAQDGTDALYRHPVRHRNRSKGVTRDMEGQGLMEPADLREPFKPVVHDGITTYIKYMRIRALGFILFHDCHGNFHEFDPEERLGLLALADDPERLSDLDQLVLGQALQVCERDSRPTAEYEHVPRKGHLRIRDLLGHKQFQFAFR